MRTYKRPSKQELIETLISLTKKHGVVGSIRWRKETGLSDATWKYYWPNFTEYVVEAGLTPNQMNTAYSDAKLLEALIPLVRRFGRMPTAGEHRIHGRTNPGLPSATVYKRLGKWADVAMRLREYCEQKPEYGDVALICVPKGIPDAFKPSRGKTLGPLAADSTGFVYLEQHGPRKEYKIGYENHLGARSYQVNLQMPENTKRLHQIETDDPRGLEGFWHRYFAEKRMNPSSEWFRLESSDIRFFQAQKRMCWADLLKP